MSRFSRRVLLAGGAGGLLAAALPTRRAAGGPAGLSVVVVGAGAFGGWTALMLRRRGAKVTLVDAWGPGNSRASSGGETRVIRGVYGANRIYTAMARRAFQLWQENETRWKKTLYTRTGALWMVADEGEFVRCLDSISARVRVRLRGALAGRRRPPLSADRPRRDPLGAPGEGGRLSPGAPLVRRRPGGIPGRGRRLSREPGLAGRDRGRPPCRRVALGWDAPDRRRLRLRLRALAAEGLSLGVGLHDPPHAPGGLLLRNTRRRPSLLRPPDAGLGRDPALLLRHPGQREARLQDRGRRSRGFPSIRPRAIARPRPRLSATRATIWPAGSRRWRTLHCSSPASASTRTRPIRTSSWTATPTPETSGSSEAVPDTASRWGRPWESSSRATCSGKNPPSRSSPSLAFGPPSRASVTGRRRTVPGSVRGRASARCPSRRRRRLRGPSRRILAPGNITSRPPRTNMRSAEFQLCRKASSERKTPGASPRW